MDNNIWIIIYGSIKYVDHKFNKKYESKRLYKKIKKGPI
jgi:hypothetical protein